MPQPEFKGALKGHGLRYEGWPFNAAGKRERFKSGYGHGKCACGALSPALPSDYKRKRWHRAHKAEVASGT